MWLQLTLIPFHPSIVYPQWLPPLSVYNKDWLSKLMPPINRRWKTFRPNCISLRTEHKLLCRGIWQWVVADEHPQSRFSTSKPHAYQHSKHPTQSDVDYHIKIQQKDLTPSVHLPGSTIFDCLSVWASAAWKLFLKQIQIHLSGFQLRHHRYPATTLPRCPAPCPQILLVLFAVHFMRCAS